MKGESERESERERERERETDRQKFKGLTKLFKILYCVAPRWFGLIVAVVVILHSDLADVATGCSHKNTTA